MSSFGPGQAVEQLLRLAGPELLALGIGDEQRRVDPGQLVAEPVLVEAEARVVMQAVGLAAEGEQRGGGTEELLADPHVAVELLLLALLQLPAHARGERLEPRGRDIDHARVGDRRGEAVLERERARDPVAGLADADHRDPVRLDVLPGADRVDHRREHRLPVGPERHAVLEQHRVLTRAV